RHRNPWPSNHSLFVVFALSVVEPCGAPAASTHPFLGRAARRTGAGSGFGPAAGDRSETRDSCRCICRRGFFNIGPGTHYNSTAQVSKQFVNVNAGTNLSNKTARRDLYCSGIVFTPTLLTIRSR